MAHEFMPPFCSGLLSVAMDSRYLRADGLIERMNARTVVTGPAMIVG
jgi:hypothetical protein